MSELETTPIPRRGNRAGKIANEMRKAEGPPAKHRIPVSTFFERESELGEISLYLFMLAGKVSEVRLWVSRLVLLEKEKTVQAILRIESGSEKREFSMQLKQGPNLLDQKFEVKRGDVATILVDPKEFDDGQRIIAGVLTGFVYEVD